MQLACLLLSLLAVSLHHVGDLLQLRLRVSQLVLVQCYLLVRTVHVRLQCQDQLLRLGGEQRADLLSALQFQAHSLYAHGYSLQQLLGRDGEQVCLLTQGVAHTITLPHG